MLNSYLNDARIDVSTVDELVRLLLLHLKVELDARQAGRGVTPDLDFLLREIGNWRTRVDAEHGVTDVVPFLCHAFQVVGVRRLVLHRIIRASEEAQLVGSERDAVQWHSARSNLIRSRKAGQ